jgi:hypothetical protein
LFLERCGVNELCKSIKSKLSYLNKLNNDSTGLPTVTQKKNAATQYNQNVLTIYEEILGEISDYYKENYINIPDAEKDIDVQVFVKELLDKISLCMFGEIMSRELNNSSKIDIKLANYNSRAEHRERLGAAFTLGEDMRIARDPDADIAATELASLKQQPVTPVKGQVATFLALNQGQIPFQRSSSLSKEDVRERRENKETVINYIKDKYKVIEDIAKLLYDKAEFSLLENYGISLSRNNLERQKELINDYILERKERFVDEGLLNPSVTSMPGGSRKLLNKKPRKTLKKQKNKITKRRNRKIKGRKTRHKSKVSNKRHTRNNR